MKLLSQQRTPSFASALRLGLEEAELARLILSHLGVGPGAMVDVGAHRGTVTRLFAPRGWQVHAFEPDPNNRMQFRQAFDQTGLVFLNDSAVGLRDGEVLEFFASEVSTGISSLVPFHESHRPVARVETIRLDTYLRQMNVAQVDFLKIDTEGFDLFVLQSFDWDGTPPPEVVLCEFEDSKTVNVGYTTKDLVDYLSERGYQVLVSEWHPITKYGAVHSWRRLARWDDVGALASDSWGNLLAVRNDRAARLAFELVPGLVSAHGAAPITHAAVYRAWRFANSLRYGRALALDDWQRFGPPS